MSYEKAISILDSLIDVFEDMRQGNSLGFQVQEIPRRLLLVRREIEWTSDNAMLANKIRSLSAFYAMRYRLDGDCEDKRIENGDRLNRAKMAFVGFRQHLMREKKWAEEREGLARANRSASSSDATRLTAE